MQEGGRCNNNRHWMTPANTHIYRNAKGYICRRCRACTNERHRGYKQGKKQKQYTPAVALEPGDPRHGTFSGYNTYRCRCDECREFINAAHRLQRLKRKAREAGMNEAEIAQLLGTPSRGSVSTVVTFEDRLVGSTFDDPVFDEVARRVG